ncbi:hypothetical protein A8924_0632 [Saccharopolyspora erythraea NRRL 2338]|uniref:Secreted protein n=1 Tax=Saccharopolyspora erythraea TaxID=1836 RepID=A0ABN1D416_SACER|nr:hypothetical protein [Saccharopolyspora erythraea]PFG93392.1 hypothetical protein A8924_0632 [Saccharopolyspora erythraea NRRL 2338]QRK90226.1 hypothetical protein JQX30_01215 [Saccharopolyspora erythraea]QRK90234.1 hypothetical protein JQX30_01305 [Saccharopolyspora erythraea]QRK90251.1 hypothetical protein JQX30_01440 [Saccharopolyspora erythraea]QRK90258.1 hypothetical protein JQX30_01505 [Saccharopolyspora erythraea]
MGAAQVVSLIVSGVALGGVLVAQCVLLYVSHLRERREDARRELDRQAEREARAAEREAEREARAAEREIERETRRLDRIQAVYGDYISHALKLSELCTEARDSQRYAQITQSDLEAPFEGFRRVSYELAILVTPEVAQRMNDVTTVVADLAEAAEEARAAVKADDLDRHSRAHTRSLVAQSRLPEALIRMRTALRRQLGVDIDASGAEGQRLSAPVGGSN